LEQALLAVGFFGEKSHKNQQAQQAVREEEKFSNRATAE
jgi:hypothetical protein